MGRRTGGRDLWGGLALQGSFFDPEFLPEIEVIAPSARHLGAERSYAKRNAKNPQEFIGATQGAMAALNETVSQRG